MFIQYFCIFFYTILYIFRTLLDDRQNLLTKIHQMHRDNLILGNQLNDYKDHIPENDK